ncbi:MAG: serine hydroxymethyltransferase, partial [Candidatus Diapherotrites archaeon]|nr:serine hydroxymethyltransferase [Candidatus Diapherotrites archaeon]
NHITAAKAVAFKEAMQPEFKEYAKQIVKNAKALADALMAKGARLVSNGTDNHLMLVDVKQSFGIDGKTAATALAKAEIYCNKNTIPYDKGTPWRPSGIRLGTPAITTRGMKETEMQEIAELIVKVLKKPNDNKVIEKVRGEVTELTKQFPFYM